MELNVNERVLSVTRTLRLVGVAMVTTIRQRIDDGRQTNNNATTTRNYDGYCDAG